MVFPLAFSEANRPARPCISNMKQCALAYVHHAGDNNDTLPLATNWIDATEMYPKASKNVFKCPSAASYGYAMNLFVSGSKTNVEDPGLKPVLFETTDLRRNTSSYLQNSPSPSRHDKNCVSFLDGHVTTP
ncbi:hypothetical protein BH11ARM1_BH11ARM1_18100 [soil metagenome]